MSVLLSDLESLSDFISKRKREDRFKLIGLDFLSVIGQISPFAILIFILKNPLWAIGIDLGINTYSTIAYFILNLLRTEWFQGRGSLYKAYQIREAHIYYINHYLKDLQNDIKDSYKNSGRLNDRSVNNTIYFIESSLSVFGAEIEFDLKKAFWDKEVTLRAKEY